MGMAIGTHVLLKKTCYLYFQLYTGSTLELKIILT